MTISTILQTSMMDVGLQRIAEALHLDFLRTKTDSYWQHNFDPVVRYDLIIVSRVFADSTVVSRKVNFYHRAVEWKWKNSSARHFVIIEPSIIETINSNGTIIHTEDFQEMFESIVKFVKETAPESNDYSNQTRVHQEGLG